MSCIFKNLPDYGQVKVPLHVDLLLCLILTRLDNCYLYFIKGMVIYIPEITFCYVQFALRVSFKVYTQHMASF